MTEESNVPKVAVKLTRLLRFSCWSVWGSPQYDGGMLGAYRSSLLLLPLTAEHPDAVKAFADECEFHDGQKPESARIDRVVFNGITSVEVEMFKPGAEA